MPIKNPLREKRKLHEILSAVADKGVDNGFSTYLQILGFI